MALCTCTDGPRCEMFGGSCCNGARAQWSVLVPASWKPPLRLSAKFACEPCWKHFIAMQSKPVKGFTRPENASDDWQPSLTEVVRHGEIAIAFAKQRETSREPKNHPKVTQLAIYRTLLRKYATGVHSR